MGKDKHKARSDEKHVRFYRYLWDPMLKRLDGNAFKALFYMLTFEDGGNNGQIFMGARSLADGIRVNKKTALRCLQALDQQGFIRPEQLGYFTQKGGPATRWRFTFLPANGKPPTNEWRQVPSEQKSWVQKFPDAGPKNGPTPPIEGSAGPKTGPVIGQIARRLGVEKRTQSIAIGDPLSGGLKSINSCPDFHRGRRAAGAGQ